MSFEGIGHTVAVICNDKPVGFFADAQDNFGDVTLGAELRKGKNVIRLVLWGDIEAKVLDNIRFHVLGESVTAKGKWSCRQWDRPEARSSRSGGGLPAWFVTKFKYTADQRPLLLHLGGSRKGQIFLNGNNVGRFWSIGPQEEYYLPRCWLADTNELVIFDEEGKSPYVSKLVYHPGMA